MTSAVGNQLTCVFIDSGAMCKDDGGEVEEAFTKRGINSVQVDAKERFSSALEGVVELESKCKIIGKEFIRGFGIEGRKIGSADHLVQGTIYPDLAVT